MRQLLTCRAGTPVAEMERALLSLGAASTGDPSEDGDRVRLRADFPEGTDAHALYFPLKQALGLSFVVANRLPG